jgi:DNA-binding NarL/FixJ family response regulator
MPDITTVVLVDDAEYVREALRWLLEHEGDFRVIGEAGDAASALALIRAVRPALVVLDIDLPGEDGLALARGLVAGWPADSPPPKIVFLTVHDDPATRARCTGLGAGFVAKSAGWPAVAACLRAATAQS